MPQTVNPLKQFFRQPSIFLRLPSEGQYWPQNALALPVNKELPVYPMTAIDEISYRTPDALFNGQAVVSVVQSCIPHIKDAWLMPSVDLNSILVSIRIASYGHEMELGIKCGNCGTESDFSLDLRRILETLKTPDYTTPIRHGDLEIMLQPVSYRYQNETNLQQYEQQRAIMQIQQSDLPDDEKIARLNEILKRITELTIESLKYSISSIRTPQALVTEPEFIHEFLQNCDRGLYEELRDRVIKLRETGEIEPIGVECPECKHTWKQTLTLDQTAFFGTAS